VRLLTPPAAKARLLRLGRFRADELHPKPAEPSPEILADELAVFKPEA
jgi:hypothetical protein